uniref:Trigger factor n=1 Tax=Lygus hesperus TaxID=30085 RepID=A0A0A9X2G1_LYGHE
MIEKLAYSVGGAPKVDITKPTQYHKEAFTGNPFYSRFLDNDTKNDTIKEVIEEYKHNSLSKLSWEYWKQLLPTYTKQPVSPVQEITLDADQQHQLLVQMMRTSEALNSVFAPPPVKPLPSADAENATIS